MPEFGTHSGWASRWPQGTSNIHSHEVLELYREAAFLWQSERIALDLASSRHITDLVIGPEQQRIKAGPMWGGKI